MKTALNTYKLVEAFLVPFWSWRSVSQFRHFRITTLHTQVSRVNIGLRVGCPSADLARRLASLSVGFPPQHVPHTDAGHLTLVSLLKHGSQNNTIRR